MKKLRKELTPVRDAERIYSDELESTEEAIRQACASLVEAGYGDQELADYFQGRFDIPSNRLMASFCSTYNAGWMSTVEHVLHVWMCWTPVVVFNPSSGQYRVPRDYETTTVANMCNAGLDMMWQPNGTVRDLMLAGF